MTSPEVTVLMSVYNGEHYLHEAIQSILDQTFKNFEFLIIDDASNDDSAEIINSFNDKRIRYLRNSENIGLTASLNKGILLSKGEYIARMDADDLSLPYRLERQIKYLNHNQEIGLLGSWYKEIPSGIIIKPPCKHDEIYAQLYISNAIPHPSAVIRRSVLTENNYLYNAEYARAQDYELWSRLIEKTKVANYPGILFLYRKHESQISNIYKSDQKDFDIKIKLDLYNRLIPEKDFTDFAKSFIKFNSSNVYLATSDFISILNVFDKSLRNIKTKEEVNFFLFFDSHVTLLKKVFGRTKNRSIKLLPKLISSPLFWHSSNRIKASFILKTFKDTIISN